MGIKRRQDRPIISKRDAIGGFAEETGNRRTAGSDERSRLGEAFFLQLLPNP